MLKRVVLKGNLLEAQLVALIDEDNTLVTIEGVKDYGDLEGDFDVIKEIEELE
ncbi:hypothetical protein [Rummeliibacillus stabekisii]|uniref:hypothetical protein n=1 Tax=Rummeliibacillus stabekisii TaxID=241244 RepID=UPI0013142451|nr:hypothetical protein [Rummeliibacillus stabekisii]